MPLLIFIMVLTPIVFAIAKITGWGLLLAFFAFGFVENIVMGAFASLYLIYFLGKKHDAYFHEYRWALGTTAYFLVCLYFFNQEISIDWLFSNFQVILEYGRNFLVAGILISMLRWWVYSRIETIKYRKVLNEFLAEHRITQEQLIASPALMKKWDTRKSERHVKIPVIKDEWDRVTMWCLFWPWSLAAFVLSDVIRIVWETLVASVKKTLKLFEFAYQAPATLWTRGIRRELR